jgi:deoxyadenosine/deoxycytidine kinase
LLIIDVDEIDFVENPEDLGSIIQRVDGATNGLF